VFGTCLRIAAGFLATLSSPARAQAIDRPPAPDILVVRDGWEADRDTVRKVLESTAAELWRHFPERELKPIVVYPRGGPVTLYQQGPTGETIIRLNTGKTYWAQYAFQFSHEFCHVLCPRGPDDRDHDWFVESLCELASLFTLRQMGETWKTHPPYGHWKSYASHLTRYADDLIKPRRLGDRTLAEWYRQHARELRQTGTNRQLNRTVAVALLPLFEEAPEHWEAVGYLFRPRSDMGVVDPPVGARPPQGDAQATQRSSAVSGGLPDRPQTFAEFLKDWHCSVPARHRPFIRQIAHAFGFTIVIGDRR
jgi:hypothetical protein